MFANKTFTVSVNITSGTTFPYLIVNKTASIELKRVKITGAGIFSTTVTTDADGIYSIQLHGLTETPTFTVSAIKLEEGSVSTLANDVPPNYAEELAKCQRYFYRMTSIGSAYPFEMGFATSATNFRVVLPTHCSMRTPVQSVTMNGGNFYAYGGGVAAGLTSVSYTGWVPNGIVVTFATSGLTQAAIYALMCNNASSYIDISCDL